TRASDVRETALRHPRVRGTRETDRGGTERRTVAHANLAGRERQDANDPPAGGEVCQATKLPVVGDGSITGTRAGRVGRLRTAPALTREAPREDDEDAARTHGCHSRRSRRPLRRRGARHGEVNWAEDRGRERVLARPSGMTSGLATLRAGE